MPFSVQSWSIHQLRFAGPVGKVREPTGRLARMLRSKGQDPGSLLSSRRRSRISSFGGMSDIEWP
jgi:hypothetical protein